MSYDRDELVGRRFEERLRQEVLALADDALVEEHRRKPFGRHTDKLERVLQNLRAIRASALPGSYVLLAVRPYEEFWLARLTGVKGQPPEPVAGEIFMSLEEAEHGIFLRRLDELRADG